eukprot:scaffold4036_cov248-Ochromonas_danica.AAC.12
MRRNEKEKSRLAWVKALLKFSLVACSLLPAALSMSGYTMTSLAGLAESIQSHSIAEIRSKVCDVNNNRSVDTAFPGLQISFFLRAIGII